MKIGWHTIEIGSIAPAKSNSMPDASAEVWNLSLDEVESVTGRILMKSHCRVSELGSAKCSFDTRHVLYSKLRPYLNKVVLPNEPGVGTSELIPMLPDQKRLDREFLAFYLRSPMFLDFANANTRGANLPRIAMKELWKHKIPVPDSLVEQRRIVASIKECIERVEEIKGLTDDQSKAESQVIRASRREFLGGPLAIPSGWKEKRLGELADVIYGISAAISNKKDPKIGPPIVRMANISIDGHLDLSDLRYCPIPKGKENHFALNPGDLLLNWRSGSAQHVGKTALFNETGLYTCASFILRIRSKEGISNNRYLRHVLNFMRSEGVFSGQSRMQINHKLNATEFSAFPIRIPSTIQEQEIIADRLDAIETFSNQIRKEISTKSHEIEELREAILRKAFTGEL